MREEGAPFYWAWGLFYGINNCIQLIYILYLTLCLFTINQIKNVHVKIIHCCPGVIGFPFLQPKMPALPKRKNKALPILPITSRNGT